MSVPYGGDCSSVLLLGLQLSAVVVHYIVPRHVSLCPLWNKGHVKQAFMSLSLGPLWLKIKIVAVGFIPAIH